MASSKPPGRSSRRAPTLAQRFQILQQRLSDWQTANRREQRLRRQRQQRQAANAEPGEQWLALRRALQFRGLQRRLKRPQRDEQPKPNPSAWLWPRAAEVLSTRQAAVQVLRHAASATLLVTVITTLISAFPLKLTTANWYLELLVLVGQSLPLILFASVAALLSLLLDRPGVGATAYRAKVMRLARLGYIFALLLLPLQLACTTWLFGDAFNQDRIQRNAIRANANALISGAQGISSTEQFITYLRSRNLNANFQLIASAPLGQVKAEFIRSMQLGQQQQEQALAGVTRSTLLRYSANALRLFVTLLVLAIYLRSYQVLLRRSSFQRLPSAASEIN